MTALFRIAAGSLWNRRFTISLTLITIAISVMLLLGVERIRQDARNSFLRSASGIDLIVGARSHPVQLMLYSVFRLGEATGNVSWQTYRQTVDQPGIAWSVPISLGDSHRGYRVVGTTMDYFSRVTFGAGQPLRFAAGRPFEDVPDAVLGAEVARELGYRPGDQIVLAHGTAAHNPNLHDDRPFTVVGVLDSTGTPIDQGVYVSLQAIEAIHTNWRSGTRIGKAPAMEALSERDLQPRSITAFYLGLSNRMAVFSLQRWINEYRAEPMTAVLPGVALQQLWALLGTAERALAVTAACMVLTGILGLLALLLSSVNERRREMSILRSVGAGPRHVFALLLCETLLLVIVGTIAGYVLLQCATALFAPWVQARYGLLLTMGWPSIAEMKLIGCVVIAGLVAGCVPAFLAYRRSVADGISIRA